MPVCFNGTQLPTDFVGKFKQLVTANQFVYGIDENDALHAPEFMLSSYPAGKYKQIIANNGASCALRDDGAIFCSPVAGTLPPPTGNGYLPPPTGDGFLEVAATYGNNAALRHPGGPHGHLLAGAVHDAAARGAAQRNVHPHRGLRGRDVRHPHRRHDGVLGIAWIRSDGAAHRLVARKSPSLESSDVRLGQRSIVGNRKRAHRVVRV